MYKRCLLLKTKDGREFLTATENLPSLIEFAKTFHAEIYKVSPWPGQVLLELKMLTMALCDPFHKTQVVYKKPQKIYPEGGKTRQAIIKDAHKIRAYIENRLMAGKPVSLKELKERFAALKLTDACLCSHLASARNRLAAKHGLVVQKVRAGTYCLAAPSAVK